ncbi:hypothetical protein [Maribacter sp. 2307ULW6-5]|uniref:hypothetical protein n=1 Tax=Maribacter sp. 2307ULW6-5 TaxID=3386275 RepID=UPI0039BD101F
MPKEVYRTCPKCSTVNLNRDYCKECGAIVNVLLKRRLEREEKEAEKSALEALKKPNPVTVFFERARNHNNLLVKGVANFFYYLWVVVLAIGSFIAFIFSYIAA